MFHKNIVLPTQLRIVNEEGAQGVYEIEGLYPGYGHTLGNSLRRIILSSLPGVSIISVKIKGADHEFATLPGIKEDVLSILLNLKKVRFSLLAGDEARVSLKVKGAQEVKASCFETSAEVEVTTPDQYIAEITSASGELEIELELARGIGFVSKEDFPERENAIGTIFVDAIFSPIRKVNYEVENMRVGDRTDYNLLRISLETDGSISAKEALESALHIMIDQFRAILDLKIEKELEPQESLEEAVVDAEVDFVDEIDDDERVELLKTRVDTLDFSSRTEKALAGASIRTLGGIVQKTADNLLALDGFGQKSLDEVVDTLATFKLSLKDNNNQ